MKTLPLLAVSLVSLSATPENPLIPETWFQEITATDGSTQQCIIFTTVPGVEYTFYHSNDLASWTEVEKTYGLGQEFAAAMRETAPAPPPPDPQNPPITPEPFVSASISIAPSSDPAGGTVVSWASLDHGNAVRHLIPATMAAEWSSVPIFAESHGTHWFAILPSSASVAPPEANGFLGQNDAAMIADLEAGFASFNQAVISAAINALNTPPPPPPAPDSKGFWRIKADWTLDSDNDGSFDHVEYVLAAAKGAAADGLVGDAFNADSNEDDIPDGEQLDGDGDGIPDAHDIASKDPLIGYEIIALPRYAVFKVDPGAFQINDRGSVLYWQKLWKNGAYTTFQKTGDGLHDCFAIAMNDHDQILGMGDLRFPTGQAYFHGASAGAYWTTPASNPIGVRKDLGGETFHSISPPGDINPNSFRHLSRFSNSREFCAEAYTRQSQDPTVWEEGTYQGNKLWQISEDGTVITQSDAPDAATHINDSSITWGYHELGMEPETEEKGPRVFMGGDKLIPPFEPLNLIPHTTPELGAVQIATGDHESDKATVIFHDNQWKPSELLAQATDIADDGTAISRRNANDESHADRGILLNGKWTPLSRAAPSLPEAWSGANSVFLGDTTPGGWILARNATKSAAMLPLRIEGIPGENVAYNPYGELSTLEATGIDNTSVGADAEDPSAQDKLWIMAPTDIGDTQLTIHAPAHATAPVKISATGVTFNGAAELTLNSEATPVVVKAPGAESGDQILAEISMGDADSISYPIGFKAMKGRTVRVAVYLIYINGNGPDLVLPQQFLQDYLNKVFSRQINVDFEVINIDHAVSVDWDTNGNGDLDVTFPDLSAEQKLIHNTVNALVNPEDPNETGIGPALAPDITVYMVGGDTLIDGSAIGFNNSDIPTVWIPADPVPGVRRLAIPSTIAHEIGHIFFGVGHPDTGTGPAPLRGTNRSNRLMLSAGKAGIKPGVLTVKGEWDKADDLVQQLIDKRK